MASPRFSQLLIDLRVDKGFKSGRSFAAAAGLSREAVRTYETGRAIPTNESLTKIFSATGVDLDSDVAKDIISSICLAREEKTTSQKRSYGVAATKELRRYIKDNTSTNKARVDRLVNLFLEYVDEDRKTDSFEFFLRQKIETIMEDE